MESEDVIDAAREMKARMRADLRRAMKAGRTTETLLLRALIAAIDNAEAPAQSAAAGSAGERLFLDGSAEVERLLLSAATVRALLEAEMNQRLNTAAEMRNLNRPDRADALCAEAQLVRRYIG